MGVSASNDFTAIKKTVKKFFSGLRKGQRNTYSSNQMKIGKHLKSIKGKIFFYKKELPQTTIVIGTSAPPVTYEGNYALKVSNYILGGGSFNSRLMREIRVKIGLAYMVQSIVRGRKNTGVFLAFTQTKNNTAKLVLTLLLENIKIISEKRVSADELKWAKEAIIKSYIFKFDTPANILNKYLDIEYNDLPSNYNKTYMNKIKNVTNDAILKQNKSLFKNGFVVVVLGSEKVKESIKNFGEIVDLN